ncbi:peptidoglycan-binding domain-containing protein [Micromonospora sp. NPDC001898]|uniref:peptidoglycan-binding domain-containing protein n=1 Tax=Micromonospora sp. NPDC001898 TaxID=3364221 RepID=UPI0036AE1499
MLDLQERLVACGLRVPVDGWFGPDTAGRVMAFQVLAGLPVSGMELSRLGVDRRTALDPDWSTKAARDVWSRTGDLGHWRCAPS